MNCYPVAIPTLCRFEHFKKCIESLVANPLALHTEIYIGLDYPYKKEHWEGYLSLCEYIPSISGFKDIHIFKREKNCGSGKNLDLLLECIFKKFDAVIISEDDNVFSPNFLEYINRGLVRFKNDPSVFAICGYRHFYNIKFRENNYFRQNVAFSAWGYGIWKSKMEYQQILTKYYFRKKLLSPRAVYRVWKHGYSFLLNFLQYAWGNWDGRVIDSVVNIYMGIENKTVIMPTISKVRNMGWDGSGEHCAEIRKKQLFANQMIDSEAHFEYQGNGWNYFSENEKIYANENYARISFKEFIRKIFSRLLRFK